MTYRRIRLAEEIKKEVSDMLLHEIKDPRVGFVTITDVEVSPDLRTAKIYASVLGSAEEQKATMDAVFALALGLYTYVNPVPTVTGGPNLVKLLTEDCAEVTGGVLRLEKDAAQAAENMLAHIESRREKLGL